MFLGHFAVALAAKRAAPRISLGTLFLAAQLADLVWPVLLLMGLERVEITPGITAVTPFDFVSYPWSHSLVMSIVWGVLAAGAYAAARGRANAAILLPLVVSHWILDLLSHRPDMPLLPGAGPKLGFGLWNSVPATLAVELVLFAVGLAVYARATVPRDRTGVWSLWALAGFMVAIYLGSVFGPPPPSVTAVAWGGFAMWLLIAWGYWIDRHRQPRG